MSGGCRLVGVYSKPPIRLTRGAHARALARSSGNHDDNPKRNNAAGTRTDQTNGILADTWKEGEGEKEGASEERSRNECGGRHCDPERKHARQS